jgi:hypothetical protein
MLRCLLHARRSARVDPAHAALLLLATALLAGCSGRASSVSAPAGTFHSESPFSGTTEGSAPGVEARELVSRPSGYPLAVGNRWDYVRHTRLEAIPLEGEPFAENFNSRWRVEVVGTTTLGAHEYFQVAEAEPSGTTWPATAQFLQRQDAEGFYEVDASPVLLPPASGTAAALAALERSLAASPHRAAFARAAARIAERLERVRGELVGRGFGTTAAEPNELIMLRYPLRTGQSWLVRTFPRFGREIVGQDELILPVGRVRAWRVRGFSELYGPRDRVFFWYGRAGLVRVHHTFEMEAFDLNGNPVGRVIGDFDQSLVRVSLQAPLGPS